MQSNENDLVNTAKVSFKKRHKLKYTCSPLCSENSLGRLIHKEVNLVMTDSRSKRETPNPHILFLSVHITIARLKIMSKIHYVNWNLEVYMQLLYHLKVI